MKIIKLNEIAGKSIKQYDSVNFLMRRLLLTEKPSHVGVMELAAHGIIGYHQTTVPQALILIEGEGTVRAGSEAEKTVKVGDIVFWEKEEGHETRSVAGLKAIVIESEGLDISSV